MFRVTQHPAAAGQRALQDWGEAPRPQTCRYSPEAASSSSFDAKLRLLELSSTQYMQLQHFFFGFFVSCAKDGQVCVRACKRARACVYGERGNEVVDGLCWTGAVFVSELTLQF